MECMLDIGAMRSFLATKLTSLRWKFDGEETSTTSRIASGWTEVVSYRPVPEHPILDALMLI